MRIPIPTYRQEVYVPLIEETSVDDAHGNRIRTLMAMPNWKCGNCSSVVGGWVMACPYCKSKLSTDTPRPSNYRSG